MKPSAAVRSARRFTLAKQGEGLLRALAGWLEREDLAQVVSGDDFNGRAKPAGVLNVTFPSPSTVTASAPVPVVIWMVTGLWNTSERTGRVWPRAGWTPRSRANATNN